MNFVSLANTLLFKCSNVQTGPPLLSEHVVYTHPPLLSEHVGQTCPLVLSERAFQTCPPLLSEHGVQMFKHVLPCCPNMLKHVGRAAGVPTAVGANPEAGGDSERPIGLHQGDAGTSAQGDQMTSSNPNLSLGGKQSPCIEFLCLLHLCHAPFNHQNMWSYMELESLDNR